MNDIVPIKAGASVRESAAGTELTVRGETQGEALAARAQAEVYGAMQLALKRPRDLDLVRQELLKACKRPAFAEKARFALPRGKEKIYGWSIRFAEEVIRCLHNLYITQAITFEDEDKRIVSVRVIDLETNNTRNAEVSIAKTVERRFVKDGQTVIAERKNSEGITVFIVQATDDELLMKQNSAVARVVRNLVLAIAPSDLLDEAYEMIGKAMKGEFDKDPAAARKALLDAFLGQNIPADQVKLYLGHDIGTATPAEMQELRELYQALREGQTNWQEAIEHKLGRPVEGVPCEGCGEDVAQRKAALSRKQHGGKVLCLKCAPGAAPKPAAKPSAAPAATEPQPAAPSGDAPLTPTGELARLKELLGTLNAGKRTAVFTAAGFQPPANVNELDTWDATAIGVLLEEAEKRAGKR